MSRPKNVVKVIKERLNNPLDTTREVAERIGIDHSTVSRIDKELQQAATKDDRIVGLCETDFEIVQIGQKIIKERLQDKEEVAKMRTFEVAQTIEKSEKRYMIFKGPITNPDGGLKGLSEYTDSELMRLMGDKS